VIQQPADWKSAIQQAESLRYEAPIETFEV
jgi:hypothetical protein